MKNLKLKTILLYVAAFTLFIFYSNPAFAHVVVKPNQVGVGAFQTFTIGVPNEKENPTIAVRLVIPQGLQHVSPNVKPGWTITVKKSGDGDDAKVTEIQWTAGSIPQGQRDDFLFSAQVPAEETTLQWKAYQTYQDGTVVAWDQTPTQDHADTEEENTGPYSETKIVNDLAASNSDDHHSQNSSSNTTNPALPISIGAFVLAAAALAMKIMKKK